MSVVLGAGQTRSIAVPLNSTGRRLLRHGHRLRARLTIVQLGAGAPGLSPAVVTFHRHAARPHRG